MTNSIPPYLGNCPAAPLTLVSDADDHRCDEQGDDLGGNGEPLASHVDVALCDVADYLRANGMCHPDVIQKRCRTLVAHARKATRQDSASNGGIALRIASLRLTSDWVEKLHDDLIVDHLTPTQHYISKFDDVISDPWLLEKDRARHPTIKDQICRRVCRVIPNVQRQPMRHTETPALIGPLRREWWTTKAGRVWVCVRSTGEAIYRVVWRWPISNAN